LKEHRGAKLVPSGEGKILSAVGDTYFFKAVGEETDGAYALFEAIVPPEGGPPPHLHRREQEAFYIIEGKVQFQVDGRTIDAGAGTFVHIPVGVPHTFKNVRSTPARMLILVVPAGFEKFLVEVGHPMADASAPPPPVTPADIERLLAVAPKYGIEIKPAAH
jgi:quercetin dioxygenase-like cupin family protein